MASYGICCICLQIVSCFRAVSRKCPRSPLLGQLQRLRATQPSPLHDSSQAFRVEFSTNPINSFGTVLLTTRTAAPESPAESKRSWLETTFPPHPHFQPSLHSWEDLDLAELNRKESMWKSLSLGWSTECESFQQESVLFTLRPLFHFMFLFIARAFASFHFLSCLPSLSCGSAYFCILALHRD